MANPAVEAPFAQSVASAGKTEAFRVVIRLQLASIIGTALAVIILVTQPEGPGAEIDADAAIGAPMGDGTE